MNSHGTRRIAAAAAVLVAVTLTLVGCASGSSAPAETVEANTELKLGFLTNGGQTPTYVAVQEGFFANEGLNVTRVDFQDSASMIAALERGDVDVISSIPSGPLAAIAAGADLQAIVQNETAKYEAPDSGTLIASHSSGIEEWGDLSGKKVAIFGGLRGQLNAGALPILEEHGVSQDSVQWMDAPFASMRDLLASGQADAVMTIDPFTTSILSDDLGTVIAYPYIEANPGQPLSAWWAPRDWIEVNEPTVGKFQTALIGAIEWLYEDDVRAREAVAAFTGLDPALIAEMPLNNWSHKLDKGAWDRNIEILKAADGLPADFSLTTEDYWAPSMQQYVAESALIDAALLHK